jgi:uncharacterized repeat protein (TIGR02543 family)
MKKYFWLAALLAALALVFTGCGGGGGGDTYMVTFDVNTDDTTVSAAPASQRVSDGGKVTEPTKPTRDDYYVVEWSLDPEGTDIWNFAEDTVTKDITLYAQWEQGQDPDALVEYDLGDYTVGDGTGDYSGWASNGYDKITTDLAIEVLLSAKYLVLELTSKPVGGVQLVWQGAGSGIDPSAWNANTITSDSGDPNPAKGTSWDAENKFFTIELSKALIDYNVFVTAVDGAKILLGYWSPKGGLGVVDAWLLGPPPPATIYTVTFNTDGGVPATIDPIEVPEGYSIGATDFPAPPTKANASFDGWFDEDGEEYTASTSITADVALKAKWAPLVTVTFNADGGTPAPATRQVGQGQQLGTLPTAPTKAGYRFDGWFVGLVNYTATSTINANVTLVAKWIQQVTVTFALDGGTLTPAPTPITLDINTPIGSDRFPGAPTKAGNIFGGWVNGTTVYTANTNITATVTLTAKWTAGVEPTFNITVNGDGGAPVPGPFTVTRGQRLDAKNFPPAEDPKKIGHVFDGWFVGATEVTGAYVPTAATTITAKWTAITGWPSVTVTPLTTLKGFLKVGPVSSQGGASAEDLKFGKGNITGVDFDMIKAAPANSILVLYLYNGNAANRGGYGVGNVGGSSNFSTSPFAPGDQGTAQVKLKAMKVDLDTVTSIFVNVWDDVTVLLIELWIPGPDYVAELALYEDGEWAAGLETPTLALGEESWNMGRQIIKYSGDAVDISDYSKIVFEFDPSFDLAYYFSASISGFPIVDGVINYSGWTTDYNQGEGYTLSGSTASMPLGNVQIVREIEMGKGLIANVVKIHFE